MKLASLGDLVTIDKCVAPPGLYGLGIIIEITHRHIRTEEPLRAKIYWQGKAASDDAAGYINPSTGRVGCCAGRYLNKVE